MKTNNRYINGIRNDYVPGSVYILKCRKGFYKIGLTRRNVYIRKRELEQDWGRLELIELVHTESMRALELKLHNHFRRYNVYRGRQSGGTEFFRLPYFQHWKARYLLHAWSGSKKPLWFYFYAVGGWIMCVFYQPQKLTTGLWKSKRRK
jgi:hypothetical protein